MAMPHCSARAATNSTSNGLNSRRVRVSSRRIPLILPGWEWGPPVCSGCLPGGRLQDNRCEDRWLHRNWQSAFPPSPIHAKKSTGYYAEIKLSGRFSRLKLFVRFNNICFILNGYWHFDVDRVLSRSRWTRPRGAYFFCTRYAFIAVQHIGSVSFKLHLNED